jgi:WD40 repeat protein
LTGYTDSVRSVAISLDGRTALSGSSDETLELWDLATGKELRTLTGHTDEVKSVAISPDGRTALSGSDDKTLKLWDLATGKELCTFRGHTKAVTSVAFSPNGRNALSGSDDKTLELWDLATGKELRTLTGHADRVKSVAISPDGRTALSGSVDKTLKLWDLTPYLPASASADGHGPIQREDSQVTQYFWQVASAMQDANDQGRAPLGIVDDDIGEAGQHNEPVRFPGQFRTRGTYVDMLADAPGRPHHSVA